MLDFIPFKLAVSKQLKKMEGHQLYRVVIDKDLLWNTYLASFPSGTNPMRKERTEHDCNCCRAFIRQAGDVVAIIDGKIVSIWDGAVSVPAYNHVSQELARLIKAQPIYNEFLTDVAKIGTERSLVHLTDDPLKNLQTWDHFFVHVDKKFVCRADQIGPRLSDRRADFDVLKRSLNELTSDAVDTVDELIKSNSILRGAEHLGTVTAFKRLKSDYTKLERRQASPAEKDLFVWDSIRSVHQAVCRIRGSSIGTLLEDLSADLAMDDAVRKYEQKVGGTSYKRPTALVTKGMVDKARTAIDELGFTSALTRRYANLSDISINNILFADRSARKVIEGDVFDMLETKSSAKTPSMNKVQEISIEKFLADIVPTAQSIEVFLENKHDRNLVSLVAPFDMGAKNMFTWANPFSWSYAGDTADSIKERVKQAGGNVEGDLRCSLSWYNYDDLDLHLIQPDDSEIGFRRKLDPHTRGQLDIDMNAGGGSSRTPVENIFYPRRETMREGRYSLYVHQYAKRESIDVGFAVEIDYLGQVFTFEYEKAVTDQSRVTVAEFDYTRANGIKFSGKTLPSTNRSKELWGLKTQEFQRVNVLMRSPNYWDEQKGVGNEHFFFMLDGCVNDGQARGFYNEFLNADLSKHRKVLEMVGAKMKTEESGDQLSGLGFSVTQRNELLVRVKGAFVRTLKVVF